MSIDAMALLCKVIFFVAVQQDLAIDLDSFSLFSIEKEKKMFVNYLFVAW